MDEALKLQEEMTSLSDQILAARLDSSFEIQPAQFILASIPLFARLRAIHRDANLDIQAQKLVKTTQRQEVDMAQLGLQNLAYEQQHLEREIRKCEEYESKFQTVELDELDILVNAGQILPDDQHALMLVRLKYELEDRQRLESRKKELLSQKLKLTKDNADKKAALDVLDKELEKLGVSAKQIQEKMSKHNETDKAQAMEIS